MKKLILVIFTIMIVLCWNQSYRLFESKSNEDLQRDTKEMCYQEDTINKSEADDSTPLANEQRLICSSAILIDADSGDVLYEKNANKKMYPASTTKILTALIALEEMDLYDNIKVGEEVNKVLPHSSKAGIDYGESMTVETLIKGLMIPSGNDAAYILARHIGRKHITSKDVNHSVKAFIKLMNDYTKALGLTSSKFTNPDGYHHDSHYSTAKDLALITKEALKYPILKEISSIPYYKMKDFKQYNKSEATMRYWENTNKLIHKHSPYYYEYAIGIKTGYTKEAGYCLVSAASYNNKTVIGVVLNSSELGRFEDSIQLLNMGLGLDIQMKFHENDEEIMVEPITRIIKK